MSLTTHTRLRGKKMKQIKLYSPNGKGSVLCGVDRVEHMKKNGWTEKPVLKTKEKKVKENGNIYR